MGKIARFYNIYLELLLLLPVDNFQLNNPDPFFSGFPSLLLFAPSPSLLLFVFTVRSRPWLPLLSFPFPFFSFLYAIKISTISERCRFFAMSNAVTPLWVASDNLGP